MFLPLSLVIPSYNRAGLIAETIECALAQTMPFQDIVVVDDGSTDHTAQVLQRFGSRIRVIRTPNQGVQAARNTGVRSTTTPLVAVCDSDDLLEPEFAATASGWMSRHPAIDAYFCNFVTFDDANRYGDKFSQAPRDYFAGAAQDAATYYDIPDLYARNVHFQPFFQSGAVVRRAFFDRIGGYDESFRGVGAEDWEFTLRAIASGRIAACTTQLARVRRHGGNDSADIRRMNLGEIDILEFSLAHHAGARQHARSVQAGINRRLRDVFDDAFALGDLRLARQTMARMSVRSTDRKSVVKRWICRLPMVLARPIWRMTQVRG